MISKHLAKNAGYSLLEIMVALGLVNLVVIGSLTLIGTSTASMKKSNDISWRNIENDEMLKMASDSTYFSLLADFAENAKLKECMTTDTIMCEQGQSYPLTAFDLKSASALATISGAAAKVIHNTLSFQIHCADNTSTCDAAEYFIVKVKTQSTDEKGNVTTTEKSAMVVPNNQKMISFIPDTAISAGRPINLLLFMDTSGSMAAQKDKIKGALDGLLTKLANLNVNVGILPLTSISSTLQAYTLDGSGNKINILPSSLPEKTPFFYNHNFFVDYGHNYVLGESMVNPGYRTIDFSQTDDAATRTTKINAARALIDFLFMTNDEDLMDVPLCSLLHYLEKPSSIFPIDPMTPTVAMVISNEDDESVLVTDKSEISLVEPLAYNKKFNYCIQQLDRSMTKGDSEYIYKGIEWVYLVRYTADVINDGAPLSNQFRWIRVNTTWNSSMHWGQDCSSVPNISSTAEAQVKLKDASYVGNFKLDSCEVQFVDHIFFTDLTNQTLCPANEAEFRSILPGYEENSCWAQPHNVIGSGYWDAVTTGLVSIAQMAPGDTDAHTTNDIVLAAYDAIKSKLNLKNFMFIPIIHGSSTGCVLTPGAHVGTKYEALAQKLGMESNIIPVCSPDYTGPIDKLKPLLDMLAAADITLPSWLAPKISGVEILRGSDILHPVRDVDYKIVDNVLVFTLDYTQPGDVIRVFYN